MRSAPIVAIAAALLGAACADGDPSEELPAVNFCARADSVRAELAFPIDGSASEQLYQEHVIADHTVPGGYGGYWLDGDTTVLGAVDPADSTALRGALEQAVACEALYARSEDMLSQVQKLLARPVVVQAIPRRFSVLYEYWERGRTDGAILGVDGVAAYGLRQAEGKLFVAVLEGEPLDPLYTALDALAIPHDAVRIDRTTGANPL